jgi:UDP-4-amino-4,6-dideoxy-N-acetyl-beta-L-altrosamine transaminase
MAQKHIPYGTQWIDEDDIKAVIDALKSDYITQGPRIKEFEDCVARYVGAKYAVAVSNGTTALHMACFAAGIGVGDEVITTPMTFVASANCVLYAGGEPVFADINPKTYNIDPTEIEKKITTKTKAIIPVHYTGQVCDMELIIDIAKKHNLIIIEDGAHALGSVYKGKMVGNISDMTMFSFHPVKHITTGEGGIITTNNEEYYKRMILFRTHGITKDPAFLIREEGSWYYEQQFLGNNYRITDIQAALGKSQMQKLDMFLEKRRAIANRYNFAFKDIEEIITPHQEEWQNSAWHIYVLKFDFKKLKISRKDMYNKLIEKNIGVNVHYIPVYYHPYYQKLGFKKGTCKFAEELYENIITIPLFPKMTDEEQEYVISTIINIVKQNVK